MFSRFDIVVKVPADKDALVIDRDYEPFSKLTGDISEDVFGLPAFLDVHSGDANATRLHHLTHENTVPLRANGLADALDAVARDRSHSTMRM